MDLFNTTREERERAIFANVPNAKRIHPLTSGLSVCVTMKNGTQEIFCDLDLSEWIYNDRPQVNVNTDTREN